MERKINNIKVKRQMKLSITILLTAFLIAVAIISVNSASATTVIPPGVTKTAIPMNINVKGTGFDEITTITIDLTGGGATSTNPVPMDIVFAIDSSGSMVWNDPSGLRKTASKSFVDMMDSSIDTGGVVSWDSNIDFTWGLSNDFPTLKTKIDLVDSSGSTNLNAGLNAAIAMLDANPRVGSSAEVIIFLTDGGGTYTYSGNPGSPADNAAGKGYVIYSIGLGSPATGPLIDMATATGGQYYSSPSAANLLAIFNSIYDEIITSTIPYNVDVIEVTQSYIVDEGSYNIAPSSITTNMAGETVITWLDIGMINDGDPDFSSDETVTLTFDAKSNLCGNNLDVNLYEVARVEYDDKDNNYAGTVLIPQATINVDCDTTPPTTTKEHATNCLMYDPTEDVWYMQTGNTIYLYARDDIPLATGVNSLHYELWWDSDCDGRYDVKKLDVTVFDNDPNDMNPTVGQIDAELQINQECCHMLIWYAVDNFNNQEASHEQFYRMDETPPTITKTHPDPCYYPISPTEGIIKVNGDIVLEAVDGGTSPCISGLESINWGFTYDGIWHPTDSSDTYYGNTVGYFMNGKWWYTYDTPIEFHEICKHTLEYWAVDNVCNKGPIHTQIYWVNDCQEVVWIDDNFGPTMPDWLHTSFNDKQMALDWLGPGGTAYVFDGGYHGDIVIDDVPCCDNTGITQLGEYGCFPVEESAVIHGSETIKVDDVTIKYMEFDPNANGAIIIDPGVSGITLRCNKIRKDCIDDAIGVKSLSNSMVNAELNWWGKPDGPDGGLMDDGTIANGLGVKVIGNVDVEPWLGVNAEASASTITAETGEVILFSSAGTWAYTFGECCQNAEPLPINFLWEFDDGAYSMEENPAHVYDAPGTYHVILEIHSYDSRLWGEFMFDWAYLTIHVTAPSSPLAANADGEDLGGYELIVDEEIQLYGLATGGTKPYTYYWDLGDGITISEQNPVHVYTAEGIYTATLTVTDSVGTTASDTAEVIVHGEGELVAKINAQSSGIVDENMAFNSIVTGGIEPYTYNWDFGDDTAISQEANPLHIYENTGEYLVTLTVTDDDGETDVATTTVDIQGDSVDPTEIKQVKGGLGIKATIFAGESNCYWEITVDGNLVLFGGEQTGTITAGTEETVKLGFSIALGKVNINVKAGAVEQEYTAFAIGPFYLNVKEV